MIVVLDEARAHRELRERTLPCPGCGRPLRPWGYARGRWLRLSGGGRGWLRPPRARCAGCRVTHVLLSARAPARRADAIEVVGEALLAHAQGHGHRVIAADLGLPAATVRGWIRRVSARAPWLETVATTWAHRYDPEHTPLAPTGSSLGEALSALGAAATATVRRLGSLGPPWELIAVIARGQLLVPLRSG